MMDQHLVGSLTVESGTTSEQVFRLAASMRIGRTEDNEIPLPDPRLSRHHAAITRGRAPGESGYILADLNSTNGTYLNEQKIAAPQPLQEGDRIRVGDTTLAFRWMPAAAEPVLAPGAEPTVMGAVPVPAYVPPPAQPVAKTSSSRSLVGMIVLGAGVVLVVVAIAAIALYALLGNREGGFSLGRPEPTATSLVLVVTNPPAPEITMVVTNTPGPTAEPTFTPLPTPTPEPTLEPTPTPGPMTVHVAPDGSGDYASLAEAIAAVLPGSTINLDPGTYHLPEPLTIDKSLTLAGSGMDATFVTGTAGDQVIYASGAGPLTLQDITVRYEGAAPADVVTIQDAEINIMRSRFAGGVKDEELDTKGIGLLLQGNVAGIVRESRFEGNGSNGIRLYDHANPLIEGNLIADNDESGLVYLGESGGTAQKNVVSGNYHSGIMVGEQARPLLVENISVDNQQSGIRFMHTAAGAARQNECSGNRYGIHVKGAAKPDLDGNHCHDNSKANTVLWTDDFTDPASGWWAGTHDGGEVRYENGALHILDHTTPDAATISTPGRYFEDLILEVDSYHVSGTLDNWHGIYCRYQDSDNWYVGAYSADGYYTGLAKVNGQTTEWAKEQSDAIKQGQGAKNQVRLECVGDHIGFWINDQLLFEKTDGQLAGGGVGLDAESEDSDYTEIAYENLVILAP